MVQLARDCSIAINFPPNDRLMPQTARQHFEVDIQRARSLHSLACKQPHKRPALRQVRDDLFRSSWMFSVGAFDAYFCDAYADLVARVLRAKNLQSDLDLTSAIAAIQLPVGAVFSSTNIRQNWRWRMAARQLVENDNILSISKIQQLFNPFFSQDQRLFRNAVLEKFISDKNPPIRMVGINRQRYRSLKQNQKNKVLVEARNRMVDRLNSICQRRHDCIHNCDRPKLSIQGISAGTCKRAIDDVESIVLFCDTHFENEFNDYLSHVGASASTKNAVGYTSSQV